MRQIQCEKCKHIYQVPESMNYIYFCPECHALNGCECEYGYGSITPCIIYLGNQEIAKIADNYRLVSKSLRIDKELQKGDSNLEVYDEAVSIIKNKIGDEDTEK